MFKKILIILITTCALTLNVSASSDGELLMKKNEPTEVRECF
jgi:phospholipid-binding lipoprotein MlaA